MSESMLTSEAATTTEGQATSQGAEGAQVEGQQQQAQAGEQQAQQQQQATEGQKPEGQKAEGETSEGEGDKAEKTGAPEKYEFKAPEGQEFDGEVIEAYSEIAKELDLPQDAAQKIIDKIGPVMAQKQARVLEQARTEWGEQSKADKEFGGEKLNENLAIANKAIKTFGNDALVKLLNESGLGNHPEVIRAFVKAGKAISEDRFVAGGQGGKPAAKSNSDYANSLYPSQQ